MDENSADKVCLSDVTGTDRHLCDLKGHTPLSHGTQTRPVE
jgi:hypothetical protein